MTMQYAPFWKASLRNYRCGISCRLITGSRSADRKSVNKRTKGGVYSWTNLPGGNSIRLPEEEIESRISDCDVMDESP